MRAKVNWERGINGMMNKTRIEWTESTWNPITGCTQISDGCMNCYAKRMSKRLKAMGNLRYKNEFEVTIHNDLFNQPLKTKESKMIFVCSMSDIFHESVDFQTITKLFDVMREAHWHTFQVLTKRSQRLLAFSKIYSIPENVWVGVTVENEKNIQRLEHLKLVNASTKFLSCEPLLGSLKVCDFSGIQWIVAGGESGPNSRDIDIDWVREIRDQCVSKAIPFFFKQWGGWNKKKNGREIDGEIFMQMPSVIERSESYD